MDNISEQILRNLVSSIFNIKTTDIKIGGEIKPTWQGFYYDGVSYTKCSKEGIVAIHSFDPKVGFKCITGCIASEHYYNGNHDKNICVAKGTLADYVTGDEIFFITEYVTDEEYKEGTTYTIYKAQF